MLRDLGVRPHFGQVSTRHLATFGSGDTRSDRSRGPLIQRTKQCNDGIVSVLLTLRLINIPLFDYVRGMTYLLADCRLRNRVERSRHDGLSKTQFERGRKDNKHKDDAILQLRGRCMDNLWPQDHQIRTPRSPLSDHNDKTPLKGLPLEVWIIDYKKCVK